MITRTFLRGVRNKKTLGKKNKYPRETPLQNALRLFSFSSRKIENCVCAVWLNLCDFIHHKENSHKMKNLTQSKCSQKYDIRLVYCTVLTPILLALNSPYGNFPSEVWQDITYQDQPSPS